jgi:hypothetical protein
MSSVLDFAAPDLAYMGQCPRHCNRCPSADYSQIQAGPFNILKSAKAPFHQFCLPKTGPIAKNKKAPMDGPSPQRRVIHKGF